MSNERFCPHCGQRYRIQPEAKPIPIHQEARKAGYDDGYADRAADDRRWPPGVYGQSDYWLGYREGQLAR